MELTDHKPVSIAVEANNLPMNLLLLHPLIGRFLVAHYFLA